MCNSAKSLAYMYLLCTLGMINLKKKCLYVGDTCLRYKTMSEKKGIWYNN